MALIAPAALVAAPPRTPLPFGLDSVLAWRDGDRFESGVRWSVDPCDPVMGRGGPECVVDDLIGLPKDLASTPGIGEATPFYVYGRYQCNPVGYSVAEAQGFADRQLFNGEIKRAEQALWTGDLGNTPNLSGANGYPAPISAGTHDTEWHALAAVEQKLAEEYGSLGVIHMSRRTASLLMSKGSLDTRGGRLYTELGTPVVAGSGYPDVQEIIGTAALFGYRSDLVTNSARAGDLLDRTDNTLYAISERGYLLGFDPCPVVKATYTGELNNPPEDEPPNDPEPYEPLEIQLGSIPSSPIPDGADTTIIAQTNVSPTQEVILFYAVNGGPAVEAGEMTEVNPHEFVWQVIGNSTTGDSVEVWAVTQYGDPLAAVESNHITIEVI